MVEKSQMNRTAPFSRIFRAVFLVSVTVKSFKVLCYQEPYFLKN